MNQAPEMSKELQRMYNVTCCRYPKCKRTIETGTSIRNLITSAGVIYPASSGWIWDIQHSNMIIYEKMNDIAILKATGFSGNDVKWIFMYQAMLIGLVGGCIGLILGYIVSVIISHTPFTTEAVPTIKPSLSISTLCITSIRSNFCALQQLFLLATYLRKKLRI